MLTYRDMTFCGSDDCALFGSKCHRSLTPEVRAAANKWAKDSGLDFTPISMFGSAPNCYEDIKTHEED